MPIPYPQIQTALFLSADAVNFSDSDSWGFILLISVLLAGLLAGNIVKQSIRPLRDSLIPTSVLGGLILLLISYVFKWTTGNYLFELELTPGKYLFGASAMNSLELITYHALGLGFIATSFKPAAAKLSRKRQVEILNTGLTTVSSYLLQSVLGLGVSLLCAKTFFPDVFPSSGLLLTFGYGQGTGQALNFGKIYETDYGFVGGASFGLTIAALGFISASIGGVIFLSFVKRHHKVDLSSRDIEIYTRDDIQKPNEIPMSDSIDKMSIQLALVFSAYFLAWILMTGLSHIFPSLAATFYGFNFLFGVLFASLITAVLKLLRKAGAVKREYVNPFFMKRIAGFFFDIMIVAGVAAIRVEILQNYWGLLLALGILGAVLTFVYNLFVAKRLFPDYTAEQFLVMYGMLTGTASTGIVLLRELDPTFKTPASDNLVYQNFPAIIFGFPLMLLATYAPGHELITWLILFAAVIVINLFLFRSLIFKKKSAKEDGEPADDGTPQS